jgi:OOP family OmpA-OmpF porin
MFSKRLLLQGVLVSLLVGGCATKDVPLKNGSDKPVVLFILDTSESMLNLEKGKPKIDNAKESILKTVSKMDDEKFDTALITFDKVRKCKAKREVDFEVPSNLSKQIKEVTAWGILLSDGKDNCGGNPVEEAKKLYKKYGVKVNLQVIGYAVEKKKQDELKKIAQISRDWMYHDAKNEATVQKIIDKIIPPKKQKIEPKKIIVHPKVQKIEPKIETEPITPTIVEEEMTRPISIESNIDVRAEIESFVFNFNTSSDEISGDFRLRVDELNSYIQENNKKILIIGHADARGTEEFNQKLSIKRAKSLKNRLVELGVDSNRIEIRGRGELDPIAPNNTAEGQKQNRRVEIEILD